MTQAVESDQEERLALKPGLNDDDILREAKARFGRCTEWESNSRKLFVEDIQFVNGDSDNMFQWPNDIRQARDTDGKPCLTVNKIRQNCLQIINDAKQNKQSVTVRPVGDGATFDAAEVFEGVIRHIEYISNATVAYDTATQFQVQGGIGFWRVVADYKNDDSFDQELFIRRVKDPLSIYMDPDINEVDGSDANFAFVFDDMPREIFVAQYPKYAEKAGDVMVDVGESWSDDDHVRVAEYYRRVIRKDMVFSVPGDDGGDPVMARKSEMPPEVYEEAKKQPGFRERQISNYEIEWYFLVGDFVADKRTLPGRYIPIVRVIGEETIIKGQLDRKGHVRPLKESQRMYNYFTSAAVEMVALQTKSPYIAPVEAIEGYETYWQTANQQNYSVLPYKTRDEAGNPLPPPQRNDPPQMADGYVQAMQMASQDMQDISGQYEAEMGAPSNERTGIAINARQRQGDNATYHFIDNLATAIRFTGKILIDLIPHYYDTPRVLRLLGEDGTESTVQLDPGAQQAYQQATQRAMAIFNPSVGSYDVMADTGPAYATMRQEAFNAFSQIISQNPTLVQVVGDLMFKNADFPGADEIAERLKRMVPPQALGTGPSPQVEQLQAQLKQSEMALEKVMTQLQTASAVSKGKDQQKDIDVYNAVTDRLSVLTDAMAKLDERVLSPKDMAQMLHEAMMQERQSSLSPVIDASKPTLTQDANPNAPPGQQPSPQAPQAPQPGNPQAS